MATVTGQRRCWLTLGLLALSTLLPGPLRAGEETPLSPSVRKKLGAAQLDQLIKELVGVQAQIRAEIGQREVLQRAKRQEFTKQVPELAVADRIGRDPQIQSRNGEIAEKVERLKQYEQLLAGGKSNPVYKETLKSLEVSKKELLARQRKLRPLAADELRDAAALRAQQPIDSAEARITSLTQREQQLQQEIRRIDREINPPKSSTEDRLRHLEQEVHELKKALKDKP